MTDKAESQNGALREQETSELKTILEGTPGFKEEWYQYVRTNPDTGKPEIDWSSLSQQIK